MPKIKQRFRPPWYNESVSREVGKRAGVTVDPRFARFHSWNGTDYVPRTHPRTQSQLISRKSLTPSSVMSEIELKAQNPRIAKIMDAKSGPGTATPYARATSPKIRRREIFYEAAGNEQQRAYSHQRVTTDKSGEVRSSGTPASRRAMASMRTYDVAADSQFPRSPEAIWRKQYHNVKPAQTLPYKPATPTSGKIPVPPRPSSSRVSPRIAGVSAAAILKGTGAMSALPAVVHLARGNSVGSLAGPVPNRFMNSKARRAVANRSM